MTSQSCCRLMVVTRVVSYKPYMSEEPWSWSRGSRGAVLHGNCAEGAGAPCSSPRAPGVRVEFRFVAPASEAILHCPSHSSEASSWNLLLRPAKPSTSTCISECSSEQRARPCFFFRPIFFVSVVEVIFLVDLELEVANAEPMSSTPL